MRASNWRKIIGLNLKLSIEENIETKLDSFLGKNPSSDDGWYFDEKFFAKMIKGWDGYPSRCQMIDRFPGKNGVMQGRIDRGNWSFDGNINGIIDSHLLHSASQDSNWNRITPLLNKILSPSQSEIFVRYKKEWDSL